MIFKQECEKTSCVILLVDCVYHNMNNKQKISLPYFTPARIVPIIFFFTLATTCRWIIRGLCLLGWHFHFVFFTFLQRQSQNNMSFLTPYDIQPFHSTCMCLQRWRTYCSQFPLQLINWTVILPSTRPLRCLLEFMSACWAFFKPCYLVI